MLLAYQEKLKGESVGVVFGSFMPLHQGHIDMIMRAKKENDGGCIVIVCGYDGDKGEPLLPHNKRYKYVKEFFSDDKKVAVYAINDTDIGVDIYPNGWTGWLKELDRIYNFAVESNRRVWYVGEKDYEEYLSQKGENVVLLDREINPISGTAIRKNPIKHWNKIAYTFRREYSKNILICGTFSEGKTTLTMDLGKYFNAPYALEYARDYAVENHLSDWEYDEMDFMAFLMGQFQNNQRKINSKENRGVFFADTDSVVTRSYAEYYANDPNMLITKEEFENIATLADAVTAKCRWDKIYLLRPNGIFVDDHIRYMGYSEMKERQAIYEILEKNLKKAGLWDKVVLLAGGDYMGNFKKIVEDVRRIFENE